MGLCLVGIAAACRTTPVTTPPGGNATTTTDPVLTEQVMAVMDEAADPCVDFYRYACGQWMDENPLPPDKPRFGRFHQLDESNNRELEAILVEAAADPAAEGSRGQLGRFYAACIDEPAAETAGIEALRPLLDRIDAAKKPEHLMALVAELHALGARPLLSVDIEADYDDPNIYTAHVGQGGLGLPDRQYYLDEGEGADALRKAYTEHVALMLAAAGQADAAKLAPQVVALETEIARISKPRAELRDPEKRRNRHDMAALGKRTPNLPWKAYLETLGRTDLTSVNVVNPEYLSALDGLVKKSKWPVRKAYLRWHLVHALAAHMPAQFARANFEMFDKQLRGQAEPTPRWRVCVDATDQALGEALGEQFVSRRFAGDSKDIALDMIGQIEQAFAAALPSLSWMDEVTRERAVEKMRAIINKIGHPDRYRDYASLEVGNQHLANVIAGRRFEAQRQVKEIGGAVDEAEWHMTPPTVNAYYNPSVNEMVFPAGILQPPFFSAQYPMAMNFGGIGMVMGHELTHGFDDDGRKFDGEGRLTEWWGPEAVQRFEERAQCVQELYDGYEVQPGLNQNGALTLGENIADLGGIRQAHGAYRTWAAAHGGDAAPVVEGLTNEQLLFVSFGQIWCTNASPETERVLVATDTHSHPRHRVNGPLSNFPAFWEAFSCAEGTPMHPTNVCEVW